MAASRSRYSGCGHHPAAISYSAAAGGTPWHTSPYNDDDAQQSLLAGSRPSGSTSVTGAASMAAKRAGAGQPASPARMKAAVVSSAASV